MNAFRRNIPLLAFSQAMMMSGTSLMVTTAALVGYALAPDKSLATLPLAASFIAIMITSIPAALLMARIGRKQGFVLGTLFGVAGGILATWSIIHGEFWGFVAATALVGVHSGFGNYYRFAAADTATTEQKGRAVSYILIGGVAAAFIGPNLASLSREWVNDAMFAGSYAAICAAYLLGTTALLFLRLPHLSEETHEEELEIRPLGQIMRQPNYIIALICGALGYAVMSLVMTATPLAMQHHHHHFDDASFVIQWHVLAMFAPSFFTGKLIEKLGLRSILLQGAIAGILCVVINLLGTSLWHFWLALVLLGISWNFLFIGGTTLLATTYHQAERAKTQASNDFIVFTMVTLASLSAGALQHNFGWEMVNIGVLPLLAIILIAIQRYREPQSVNA